MEGVCEEVFPDERLAAALAERSRLKNGYAPPPQSYQEAGVWELRPLRAIAWEQFPRDGTRFTF